MSKSDDAMKKLLDSIGDRGKLKRRRFFGSSIKDQDPWSDGGLSFGINNVMYGSCDFAWYTEEPWEDPFTQKNTLYKPILVIEATDCLNTKSWGSAQIQRFHHALGPFLCNINSIYYLHAGPESVSLRPYLAGSAYYITKYYKTKGLNAAYLVTTDINDIKDLVDIIARYGESSKECKQKLDDILLKMLKYFNKTFYSEKYKGDWIKYLESREITRCADGKWVKDIGARSNSFTIGSQRYGHIVLGEIITSKYLLYASKLFNPEKDILYYLFPLMTAEEITELDNRKRIDKEWNILRRSDKSWKVIGIDELDGVPQSILSAIQKYKDTNLNKIRGWRNIKAEIRNGLKTGKIKIRV
ncbi:MAG: hypothetical protein ACP5U0_08785 [Caldisphaera sp.]